MKKSTLAVLGDIHYEADEAADYRRARAQIAGARPQTVVQLGDQGGYSHCGSWQSFMEGFELLSGFERPFYTLLGNHDLEGAEYASDEQSVAAWCRAFGYERPYQAFDLGPALGICLSTTSFRANPGCQHEVRIDAAQFAWFRDTLDAHRHRPTFVFSHAPFVGSGLRVLQNIHLRCPNAWLNHTDDPGRFVRLVREHRQIKLWFSAHNHLGHGYADSTSRAADCTSVHTGVIGSVTRDGCNHSRLVEYDDAGYLLATIDHATGQRTDDLRHDYASGETERLSPPRPGTDAEHFAPRALAELEETWRIGGSAFGIHRGMLVEYDVDLAAPVGVVADVSERACVETDGARLIVDDRGRRRTFTADAAGSFRRVWEPNPHLRRSPAIAQ